MLAVNTLVFWGFFFANRSVKTKARIKASSFVLSNETGGEFHLRSSRLVA